MAYVLIVDDDVDLTEAMAVILRSAGHEVEIRLDPESGILAVKEKMPDVMVLDVMFPENVDGGFQVARAIAELGKEYHKIPILMLTSVNKVHPFGFTKDDIDPGWLPVTNFVEKPVNPDQLIQLVSDLLAGRHT